MFFVPPVCLFVAIRPRYKSLQGYVCTPYLYWTPLSQYIFLQWAAREARACTGYVSSSMSRARVFSTVPPGGRWPTYSFLLHLLYQNQIQPSSMRLGSHHPYQSPQGAYKYSYCYTASLEEKASSKPGGMDGGRGYGYRVWRYWRRYPPVLWVSGLRPC